MFQPSPLSAEVYRPPSDEALCLVRHAPWLTSPERGEAAPAARLWLQVLIAPMTQLTLVSFDLQAFLFLVFHRSRVAVIGHGVFMTAENLFLLAVLRQWTIVHTAAGRIDGGLLYASVLLLWYGGVAWRARLRAWFAVTAPIVALLYLLAGPLASLCRDRLHLSPGWGVALSALLVALSHAGERHLPPRTVDRWRWVPMSEFLGSPALTARMRLLRLFKLAPILVAGAAAEAWASLRLMHYNWLMLMLRLGYAPQRHAELRGWAERAWATGQPALDFVGTGGGTFLAPPNEPSSSSGSRASAP